MIIRSVKACERHEPVLPVNACERSGPVRSVNASEDMSRSCLSVPVNGAGRSGNVCIL